jgi:opacity protein-like surface antigen
MRLIVAAVASLSLAACASTPAAPNGRFDLRFDEAAAAPADDVAFGDAGSTTLLVDPSAPHRVAPIEADENDASTTWIGVLVGERKFSDGDLQDLNIDRSYIYGVEIESHSASSGLGWEAGYQYSSDDNDVEGLSTEIQLQEGYLGGRWTINADGRLQPYVGGGLSILDVDIDGGPSSDDDMCYGAYLHAGLQWAFDRLRFGVDLRHVFADAHVLGEDVGLDYDQLALTAAFGF